ncbi:MAG: hypothetical protein K2X09_00220 [Rickettsiales bacterium]|nr:hypothetical protein [Rickettsiales bacterium]
MPELHDSKTEKYAGPSAPALALLEGRVYSFFAGLLGLVGGAALSGRIIEENGKLVQQTTATLERAGVKVGGRTALMIAGALAGSAVMHRVGNVVGIAVGAKKSGDPEAQFNRTQARIATLENKVEALETHPAAATFAEREAARASTGEAAVER